MGRARSRPRICLAPRIWGPVQRWARSRSTGRIVRRRDRGLRLALIRCESKGMLQARVFAIQETRMYEPRYLCYPVSDIRVTRHDDTSYTVEANSVVFETPVNNSTRVFKVGRALDHMVREVGVYEDTLI